MRRFENPNRETTFLNHLPAKRDARVPKANGFVREMHTRMPDSYRKSIGVVSKTLTEHHDDWLSREAGKEVLVSLPTDRRDSAVGKCSRVPISDELESLDGEGTLVALRNALFSDIVGGIEVGRFDIETDAMGSHAGEYVIDLVAHDPGALC